MLLIRRYQSESSIRAVLVGLTLWRIKASMKGTFTDWLKSDFEALGYRQARYYMAVSLAFIEETKASLPEFLALPGDQTELSLDSMPDAKARAFMGKIAEFVDERSLGDMLSDLGIKESAAERADRKRKKAEKAESSEEAKARHAVSVQDRFNELDGALRMVRKTAADKVVWLNFSKQQHADLKAAAQETANFVTEQFIKTHGRAAKI